jgi:death-on-curing protein
VSEPDVEYLGTEDLIDLVTLLLGDPAPLRDVGLLNAAAARPATTAVGEDAYPTIWLKAAALLHSVVRNHALVDGNKRLGWLATATFLEINGIAASGAPNGGVYELVMDMASADRSGEQIAADLERLVAGN